MQQEELKAKLTAYLRNQAQDIDYENQLKYAQQGGELYKSIWEKVHVLTAEGKKLRAELEAAGVDVASAYRQWYRNQDYYQSRFDINNYLKYLPNQSKMEKVSEKLTAEELAFIEEIKAKIKEACDKSQYTYLCQRVQNENGLAYVVNRAINMMANDGIHLSSALAYLESEFEGMD